MTTAEGTTARESMRLEPTGPCWICGAGAWDRVWRDPFDLTTLPRFGPALAHPDHPPTWVVRCRGCGFGQPEALPARADYFDTLYDIPWSDADMEADHAVGYKDFIFRQLLADLGRRLAPGLPRTLLDVGCHTGRFLTLAREAGWQVEGAELAERTAAFAARRTGVVVHRVPAQELAERGLRYAAVTLTDVLEHIPRPASLVRDLAGLLAPGGVLAIKVPHGPMQRLKEGFRRRVLGSADAGVAVRFVHVNHFTVESLRRCLEGAGLDDVAATVGAPEFHPATFAGRTRRQAISAATRRAVYRVARAVPGGVRTPLAMNLQAFGTRPR
jgi:SAM-dependent methyltransferase